MSADMEGAPVALTTGGGVSNKAETVICGLDGRVRIEFIEPAPGKAQVAQDQPEDVLAIRPKRSTYWGDTLRHGSEPRWKNNGRSSR